MTRRTRTLSDIPGAYIGLLRRLAKPKANRSLSSIYRAWMGRMYLSAAILIAILIHFLRNR